MTKLDLLKELRTLQKAEDTYIGALPSDIVAAFYDNEYTNSLQKANSLLMVPAFGDLAEDATYFLWEWRPGYSITEADGTEWPLKSEEEFYVYFQKQCDK